MTELRKTVEGLWAAAERARADPGVTDFWPEPYEPPAGRGHLAERF
ncbi:hypothetical protein ACWD1Z_14085 [Streptomyces sp. NPDC002784]